jgi:hypothetical protein
VITSQQYPVVEWDEGVTHRPFSHREAVLSDQIGRGAAGDSRHQLLRVHAPSRAGRGDHFPARVFDLKLAQGRIQSSIPALTPDDQLTIGAGSRRPEQAQGERDTTHD